MLKYDFEASIGYWLLRTAREYERAVNAELAPHGITFRQCQVLGWLALEGELCQRDLADRLQVEPPSLVSQLDRMEADGWIERVGCARDRRKNLIRPTRGALPVWSKIVACAKRVRERATRGFQPHQRDLLVSLLEALRGNLAAVYPKRSEELDDATKKTALNGHRRDHRSAGAHANGRGPGLGSGGAAGPRGGRRGKGSSARRPVRGDR